MSILPLFDEEPNGGFRFLYSEFLNWGTFDSLWKIEPKGKSSLLTGANGSGKTTIVDVINTLLVPPNVRHYNQSSGAERRRERTEESYVLGAYGNIKDEDSSFVKVQNLRDKNTYSIITGVFNNKINNSFVTLGQIRYFNNNGLNSVYFICDSPLEINRDILPFDNSGEYKRRLTKAGAKFFDSFKQYSALFIKKFGFKSEKALNLFSQTVGVKVLGNINDFIRNHMLEKGRAQEKFDGVYQNFLHLLNTQKLIEKAELELEMLQNIKSRGEKYQRYFDELLGFDDKIKLFLYFESSKKLEFINFQESSLKGELENKTYCLNQILKDFETLSNQIRETQRTIDSNTSAEQLRSLDANIANLKDKIRDKKRSWEQFEHLGRVIKIHAPVDLDSYTEVQNQLAKLSIKYSALEKDFQEDIYKSRTLIDLLKNTLDEQKSEFNSLKNRDSNIPLKNIEIRERIVEGLKLKTHDIPFVGECIRVREEESLWEKSIERVLHSFALSLIVDPSIYSRVNSFINENNLKGRIVYFKANAGNLRFNSKIEDDSLINKVTVKSTSPFKEWITSMLYDNFNYRCTNDLTQFSRLDYALTSNGLIKRGDRHEKDDRNFNSFVLGWDNLKKRAKLEKSINSLIADIDQKNSELANLMEELKRCSDNIKVISTLNNYSYENIDYKEYEGELITLSKSRDEILAMATDLYKLESKLTLLKDRESELKTLEMELNRAIGVLENSIENSVRDKNRLITIIESYTINDENKKTLDKLHSDFKKVFKEDINKLDEFKDSIQQTIRNLQNKRETAHSAVINSMASFINPSKDIIIKYPSWSEDIRDLKPDINYLNDFTELYKRVLKNDLPKYRKRFKEFLNQRVMEDMASFQQTLHDELTLIKESLLELNRSLKGIRYQENPGTYLTLNSENSKDVFIRDFQRDLKNTFADAYKLASGEFSEMELFFEKSRKLLTKLKDDDNIRKKVLDVRNWLNFSAEERFIEDGALKQVYQDSQSLSGGEKAKLAYTVLASAIAYQFGLESRGNSFKFVVVDEAFSKVDPSNSRFAMNLFKKLDLQLMVVTPLDRISLVEEYIDSVQYVETGSGNKTMVYNMELKEFRENKEKFKNDKL